MVEHVRCLLKGPRFKLQGGLGKSLLDCGVPGSGAVDPSTPPGMPPGGAVVMLAATTMQRHPESQRGHA